MNASATTARSDYPFAKELITNTRGQVSKVILGYRHYRQLLELVEDAGLDHAMKAVAQEKPLTRRQALQALDEP
jgi:hypothetical protein